MSDKKRKTQTINNPSYKGPIERPIIIVDDQQIPVSRPTARVYYRYHNTLYFDKLITCFMIIALLGFLSAYIYYAYDNNKLLHKASLTCPTFYCPDNNNTDKDPICGGKGYYRDKATGKITCPTEA